MPDRTPQDVPGLGVWLALAAALIAIGVWMLTLPSQDRLEQQGMRRWLLQQPALARDEQLVLVLGTSLTGCGLDSASRLADTIRQRSGKKTRIWKLWKLNAGPATFSELSGALQSFHPAVVVVEANMLFYGFKKNKGWPAYVQRFRDRVLHREYDFMPDSKPFVVPRKITELEAFRSGLMDTAQMAGFGRMLQAWAQQGSAIVLLNFPLESLLEQRKWASPDTLAFADNLRYLKRYAGVHYNRQELRWDQSYYIDHAHLNRRGGQKQSMIFCTQVAQQLRSR